MKKQTQISTPVGLSIIALAVIILFGGVFAYQYFATKISQPKIVQPTPQNNLTAGWKTYSDSNQGVSFKYPSSWIYQKFSFNLDGVAFCPDSSNCGVQIEGTNEKSAPIIFYFYEGDPTLLTPDIIKSHFRLIDNKYKDIFDQMVSTFKFTTATVTCTPNWQCGWGSCVNGSQSQVAVDLNNCGLPSSNVNIACPALARLCAEPNSILVNLPPESVCVWGTPCNVSWQANGVVGNVSIVLDGFTTGGDLPYTIAKVPVSDGFYSWVVPSGGYIPASNNKYKIKICGTNTAGASVCGVSPSLAIWQTAQ